MAETGVEKLPNGWALVRHGVWEVSVAPDGLIMLPRHLQPEEVDDFCEAARQAALLATSKRDDNAQAATSAARDTIVVSDAAQATPAGVRLRVNRRGNTSRKV